VNERDPYDDFSSDYPEADKPGGPDEIGTPGQDDLPPPPPPMSSAESGYGGHRCSGCGGELTGTAIGGQCPSCGQTVGPTTYGAPPQQSGKAIASLVLGICSIPVCFCYGVPSIIAGVIGLIFGTLASREIAGGGFTESSRGMATAGKICSWVGILFGVGYIIFFIAMIAFVTVNAPQPGNAPYQNYPQTPAPSPSPSSPSYYYTPGGSTLHWNNGSGNSTVERGPDGQIRAKLPDGLEYGPNGRVRPAAPGGLEYGPGGNLQPAVPTPGPPGVHPGPGAP
jgi:hypothetical protein